MSSIGKYYLVMTTKKFKSVKIETRGRPRDFNKEEALEKALALFWQKGFETTSINDLTSAMGIMPPSLYSTFGNKEKLFWAAVDLYSAKYAVNISKTLAEKTNVKEAMHHLLKKLAQSYVSNKTPNGCLIVCASINYSENSTNINMILQKMRESSEKVIVNRIKEGIRIKEIPSSVDAKKLGKFFATFIQGMTIQSKDGASIRDLESIIDLAMNIWPE